MSDGYEDKSYLSISLPAGANDTSSSEDEVDSDVEITSIFDAQERKFR